MKNTTLILVFILAFSRWSRGLDSSVDLGNALKNNPKDRNIAVKACGRNEYEFREDFGEITATTELGMGPRCFWNITASHNTVLTITFSEFNIPYDKYCSWGYVEVFDGNKFSKKMEDRKLCGQLQTTTFVTSSNTALVTYYAGPEAHRGYFSLEWASKKMQNTNWKKCGLASAKPAFSQKSDYDLMYPVASNEGSWPWHAGVVEKGTYELLCQGTIVSSKYVLTAAHCMETIPKTKIQVLVGKHLKDVWEPTEQRFDIAEAHLTPGRRMLKLGYYYGKTFAEPLAFREDDISVVELKGEITFTPYVRPICMPSLPPSAGQFVMVVGWNLAIVEDAETLSLNYTSDDKLKELREEICDQNLCDSLLFVRNSVANKDHGVVCTIGSRARKTKAGPGKGDSGSGLFQYNDLSTQWEIAAVHSGAIVLNKMGKINNEWNSVYHHLSWIQKVTKNTVN